MTPMTNESTKTNKFLRLLMGNQKRIYAFILGMVPNHEDADDLFQETILVMWSKFDSFTRGTSFTAWGMTVAKYQILSARKRYSRHSLRFSQAALDLLQEEADPFVRQIDSRVQALRGCVRKLSQRDYELIQMRYENEIAIKAIAERMGRSVQSVYKRIAHIHDALLRCIRRAIGREELA
ncbi:MAG: sigma-70 family RNA polymerase sigma factor [Sedimentisphaerales bacterium]|nr:sigma-70 family RNA polymerase sigma factor [Sedimentisphaerales bacterium]